MITPTRSPALVRFDVSAAFPSLYRGFVDAAFVAMQVAPGVRNVICVMYAPSWSYADRPDLARTPGLNVATGVPNRCPLCATIRSFHLW